MSNTRFRNFCGCLPVRIGVCVIALLGLLEGLAGVITTAAYISTLDKVTLITASTVYGLLSLISAIGLIGVFKAHHKMVLVYFYLILPYTLFCVTMAIITVVIFFMGSASRAQSCRYPELQDLPLCQPTVWKSKVIPTILFCAVALAQIYGCFVVNAYQIELGEEAAARARVADEEAEFHSLDANSLNKG